MVLSTSDSIGSILDGVTAPTKLKEKQEMHECSQLQIRENSANSNFLKNRVIFLCNKKSMGRQSVAVAAAQQCN